MFETDSTAMFSDTPSQDCGLAICSNDLPATRQHQGLATCFSSLHTLDEGTIKGRHGAKITQRLHYFLFATGEIVMVSATTFFLFSGILVQRLWESGMKISKEMVVVCGLYFVRYV